MSERPYLKFFPADWRGDPALRMCSLAARGLWADMLCIMHEAKPRGSLLINGHKVNAKQLAQLCGASAIEVAKLLGELFLAGVYSREEDGTIFSRRMRREAAKSEVGRKHVAKRWGNKVDGAAPIEQPTSEANSPPNRSDHSLESTVYSLDKERDCRAKSPTPYPEDFENQFWKPYPRTQVMSKKEALTAWKRLSEQDRRAAIAAVPLFVAFLKSKPDHPAVHACRFLSQRRFDGFVQAVADELAAQAAVLSSYRAAADSPQLLAWEAHRKRTEGRGYPRDRDGGWTFPSEWPPGHQAEGQNHASATH